MKDIIAEIDYFASKEALREADQAWRRMIEARTVRIGELKILCLGTPTGMRDDVAVLYSGPGPKQHVWITNLGH